MHLALNFQSVDPARGGAETYVADLCRYLVRAGHRVDLYAERWAVGCLPVEVNVVPVAAPGRTRLERIWSFARNSEGALRQSPHDCSVGFINTYAHDVIIPQGGTRQGSLAANSRRFSSGLARGLYLAAKAANPKNAVYAALERRQYSPDRRALVVAVSQMVKRHIESYHHVHDRQIRVVPNAIDPARVAVGQPGAVRCSLRNRLGLEPGDLTGLFVGHNFALKGLRPLLHALAARQARNRGARSIDLVVCGNGAIAPFERLARRLGVRDRVHFMGYHPDVRACYWSSDFFVQPTYYDPCSLVVLEALACGLPVITTAQNGASELLTDGREGYILTAPDALNELIAALDHLADDATRRVMSAQAYKLGQLQSFDAHVERLIAIFGEVAQSKARRGHDAQDRQSTSAAPHFDRVSRARR